MPQCDRIVLSLMEAWIEDLVPTVVRGGSMQPSSSAAGSQLTPRASTTENRRQLSLRASPRGLRCLVTSASSSAFGSGVRISSVAAIRRQLDREPWRSASRDSVSFT